MQQDKVKVTLGDVSQTLLAPLWGRAQLSREHSSLFYDAKAIELVEKIDYDFSTSDVPFMGILFTAALKDNVSLFSFGSLRAKQFDDKIRAYITEHPRASVISLGAGLDTTFYRVDNGTIHWYDLDLPAAIDIRRQLLPEPDRVTYIAKSLLDPSWCKDVEHTEEGVFMIAGGLFYYFEESQVKQFFSMLADNFPGDEIVFDVESGSDDCFGAWMNIFPPEQRDKMRAAWPEALKAWWEKAPQDRREKLNDMINAFKTTTKPKGKEWADLEAWWDQLTDKEKEGAIVGFMTSFSAGVSMWTLKDASEFAKWDTRITVIDQFPLYRNIPRDSVSAEMRRFMDYNDERGGSSIIHLRV